MCLFASQFTAEEIQAVNEMKRLVLDKVSFSPFPFIRNMNELFSDTTVTQICLNRSMPTYFFKMRLFVSSSLRLFVSSENRII